MQLLGERGPDRGRRTREGGTGCERGGGGGGGAGCHQREGSV